jgi:hypothetical protein
VAVPFTSQVSSFVPALASLLAKTFKSSNFPPVWVLALPLLQQQECIQGRSSGMWKIWILEGRWRLEEKLLHFVFNIWASKLTEILVLGSNFQSLRIESSFLWGFVLNDLKTWFQ